MTSQEMKDAFLLEFDNIASFTAPGYIDSEINYFLNRGQENYVKFGYNPNANAGREGYEETEKRSKDLSELDRNFNITVFTPGNHPNSFFASLPDKLWLVTREEATITFVDECGDTITDRVEVRPVTKNYYNSNIFNPDKQPYDEMLWRLDFSRVNPNLPVSVTNPKQHELITFQGCTVNTYHGWYIKYPNQIDVAVVGADCELDPATHYKIVSLAVELAIENSKSQRLQTKKIQETIIE